MNKISKVKKMLILFLMIIIVSYVPRTAYADFGPKDRLIVHVINPPDEPYYLDLLRETQKGNKEDDTMSKKWTDEDENKDMAKLLYSYEDEGWEPVPIGKNAGGSLMWGKLIGDKDGKEMKHTFGYVGVPKVYRIIIVTQSGQVSVSDVHTRATLQSSIIYDYASGKATAHPSWVSYAIQYLSTYIPTIIIEGIILLLFGFKLKDNWKTFLIVNADTQVILTFTVGMALIYSGLLAYLIQIPVEIFITIIETSLYRKYLVGKSDKRKLFYGVVANIASWFAGFLLLSYQWEILMKYL